MQENGNQVCEPIHHLLPTAQLGGIVEIGEIRKLIGIRQRSDDLLFIWSPTSDLPLSATISLKLDPSGMVMGAKGMPAYLSLTYLLKSSTRT